MKILKIISVASGFYSIKRAWAAGKALWTQANAMKSAAATAGQEKLDPDEERKGKYRVYSHIKKRSFYADDFGAALSAAYAENDIQHMKQDSRNVRRIQAYGALSVYTLSTVAAFKMLSMVPLFSIFPATLVLVFALRNGCREESLKRRVLVGPDDYFRLQGTFGLWK